MPIVTAKDGTTLFCRRWADGPPIMFAHSWATNSEVWQPVMIALTRAGFQAVAYDRRGHGRSDDPGRGYDFDTLADDLASVLHAFDLKDVTLVGHSMGNNEIIRYLTRHGAGRFDRVVMTAPSLPNMLKSPDNPDGPNDPAVLETWRKAWASGFGDWVAQAVGGAYGNETAAPPERVRQTVRMMLKCSVQAAIDVNVALTETNFTTELSRVVTPTLVLHGDADQICPLDATGRKLPDLMPNCRLKVYPGANHTLIGAQARQIAEDIVAFVGETAKPAA
jgi:non-heme chloroperoxidase